MKVQLIVVKGKPEGKAIPLTGPSFKIGRGEKCHLRPNSELVSREHTEITLTDDRVSVRDLGSRNGTLVNGKTIKEERVLKNGDLVQVGPLTFAVDIQGAPVASEIPAPAGGKKKKPSLEGVSHDEIDAWLIADDAHTPPERPSGVYKGDTQTFEAYKGDKPKAAKPEATKPEAAKPEAPAPKAAPKPAKPEAPAPKAAPKPAKPEPAPAPAPAAAAKKEPEFEMDFDPFAPGPDDDEETAAASTEPEPEAEPEPEPEPEAEEVGAVAAAEMPEELIDESNPFHVKKPTPEEAPKAKPKLDVKDSAAAANDILKRMMERRRSSK